MPHGQPRHFYRFGQFRIDVEERRLFDGGGAAVVLTPKAFDTLLYLVQNGGRIVGREELMREVWPDSFVEENNLTQNISTLRKALGIMGAGFIETVPKRGYRFLAEVSEEWEGVSNPTVRESPGVAGETPAGDGKVDVVGALRPPETKYARSGEVNIAYQVVGDAPLDLVFVLGWVSHLEYLWLEPSFARFVMRLASFARVILFDKRGTGLSDRVPNSELPTLEQRMDDVRAVMDAVGSERAALCGISDGGPLFALFAATYPARTHSLVMIGTYASRRRNADYPWGRTDEEHREFLKELQEGWGGPLGLEERAPSVASDPQFRDWWATYLRMGASPGAALAMARMNAEIDMRPLLPSIRVPTLVIHRRDDRCISVEEGRYIAGRILGSKFVELPGQDHLPFVGDQEAILDEVEEFLTGIRRGPEPDTVLATIIVMQLVGAEEHAARLGEVKWLDLEGRLHAHIGREIERFRGRLTGSLGHPPLAIFDGPARAIRCVAAISEYASRLGLLLRAGLHTGECDLSGEEVGGAATQLCARVAAEAAPGEILVTGTVKDLATGSGIEFEDKGGLPLKISGDQLRLFIVRKAVVSREMR
jgi:pimeloyl-ACP methyl ester carboxylesterase/DNA-binding winged helix-turn-helix (wHTH) protein